ncbi:hypothetical protein QBC32DRAFT_14841 [Pseudoneurospora amorphoporcata]|uniref:Uncharacterized protein n=1 Tax=Pseudoneurospora amorphoporcata TaxID=241081 RepID=A0AAN6NR96_9PEZI|nr:hypothetical protein QBC32DRAFT_14841 [Pseudoneurospora amorphoporcata]
MRDEKGGTKIGDTALTLYHAKPTSSAAPVTHYTDDPSSLTIIRYYRGRFDPKGKGKVVEKGKKIETTWTGVDLILTKGLVYFKPEKYLYLDLMRTNKPLGIRISDIIIICSRFNTIRVIRRNLFNIKPDEENIPTTLRLLSPILSLVLLASSPIRFLVLALAFRSFTSVTSGIARLPNRLIIRPPLKERSYTRNAKEDRLRVERIQAHAATSSALLPFGYTNPDFRILQSSPTSGTLEIRMLGSSTKYHRPTVGSLCNSRFPAPPVSHDFPVEPHT